MKLPEMTSKRKILAALALVALLGGGTYVLRLGGEEKKAPEDPSVPVVLERIAHPLLRGGPWRPRGP